MDALGLSMALGTFIAGVLLAESEYRHELEIAIDPFKGLLLGLFFISVGMALNLGVLYTHLLWVVVSVAVLVTVKVLSVSSGASIRFAQFRAGAVCRRAEQGGVRLCAFRYPLRFVCFKTIRWPCCW